MAERRRGFETIADMGRSLGVTLLFVAFLVGAVALGRGDVEPRSQVDYQRVLADVRREAPYHILAPEGLGEGWASNGVTYDPSSEGTRWHLGFVSPNGTYVGLDQSDGDAQRLVDRLLAGYEPDGAAMLAGQHWERWLESSGRHRDRAMVSVGDGVVTVVVGTGSYDEIEYLIGRLR